MNKLKSSFVVFSLIIGSASINLNAQTPADFESPAFVFQLNDSISITVENPEEALNDGSFNNYLTQKQSQISTVDNMPLVYPNTVHKNIPEFYYDDRTYTIQVAP